ncbi:MAG: carbon monoxide dehydrogenase beta subunit family protein [Bacillota bacterium]|nr:carbon monoxide dehydrogenase beta subunit family protein [Bacillota bacterium]
MAASEFRVLPGPEGYLPPAAASMGVELPQRGEALVEGRVVPEEEAMLRIAERLLAARNPVFFPGPTILWAWKEGAAEKARAVLGLMEAVGARAIPMPDYRPKYPMINPAVEINPNHPNLTIWHNRIDVGVFVGVHCHYANVALKIIRGGTDCYTIALCGEMGHEDAMITLRDVDVAKLERLTEVARALATARLLRVEGSGAGG